MKWKTKAPVKEGDVRTRIIFALLPRECTDRHTRWLQRVVIEERFRKVYLGRGVFGWGWSEFGLANPVVWERPQ